MRVKTKSVTTPVLGKQRKTQAINPRRNGRRRHSPGPINRELTQRTGDPDDLTFDEDTYTFRQFNRFLSYHSVLPNLPDQLPTQLLLPGLLVSQNSLGSGDDSNSQRRFLNFSPGNIPAGSGLGEPGNGFQFGALHGQEKGFPFLFFEFSHLSQG